MDPVENSGNSQQTPNVPISSPLHKGFEQNSDKSLKSGTDPELSFHSDVEHERLSTHQDDPTDGHPSDSAARSSSWEAETSSSDLEQSASLYLVSAETSCRASEARCRDVGPSPLLHYMGNTYDEKFPSDSESQEVRYFQMDTTKAVKETRYFEANGWRGNESSLDLDNSCSVEKAAGHSVLFTEPTATANDQTAVDFSTQPHSSYPSSWNSSYIGLDVSAGLASEQALAKKADVPDDRELSEDSGDNTHIVQGISHINLASEAGFQSRQSLKTRSSFSSKRHADTLGAKDVKTVGRSVAWGSGALISCDRQGSIEFEAEFSHNGEGNLERKPEPFETHLNSLSKSEPSDISQSDRERNSESELHAPVRLAEVGERDPRAGLSSVNEIFIRDYVTHVVQMAHLQYSMATTSALRLHSDGPHPTLEEMEMFRSNPEKDGDWEMFLNQSDHETLESLPSDGPPSQPPSLQGLSPVVSATLVAVDESDTEGNGAESWQCLDLDPAQGRSRQLHDSDLLSSQPSPSPGPDSATSPICPQPASDPSASHSWPSHVPHSSPSESSQQLLHDPSHCRLTRYSALDVTCYQSLANPVPDISASQFMSQPVSDYPIMQSSIHPALGFSAWRFPPRPFPGQLWPRPVPSSFPSQSSLHPAHDSSLFESSYHPVVDSAPGPAPDLSSELTAELMAMSENGKQESHQRSLVPGEELSWDQMLMMEDAMATDTSQDDILTEKSRHSSAENEENVNPNTNSSDSQSKSPAEKETTRTGIDLPSTEYSFHLSSPESPSSSDSSNVSADEYDQNIAVARFRDFGPAFDPTVINRNEQSNHVDTSAGPGMTEASFLQKVKDNFDVKILQTEKDMKNETASGLALTGDKLPEAGEIPIEMNQVRNYVAQAVEKACAQYKAMADNSSSSSDTSLKENRESVASETLTDKVRNETESENPMEKGLAKADFSTEDFTDSSPQKATSLEKDQGTTLETSLQVTPSAEASSNSVLVETFRAYVEDLGTEAGGLNTLKMSSDFYFEDDFCARDVDASCHQFSLQNLQTASTDTKDPSSQQTEGLSGTSPPCRQHFHTASTPKATLPCKDSPKTSPIKFHPPIPPKPPRVKTVTQEKRSAEQSTVTARALSPWKRIELTTSTQPQPPKPILAAPWKTTSQTSAAHLGYGSATELENQMKTSTLAPGMGTNQDGEVTSHNRRPSRRVSVVNSSSRRLTPYCPGVQGLLTPAVTESCLEKLATFKGKSATALPLFIVHPITGRVDTLKELAERLNCYCFGIKKIRQAPDFSVETLARFYCQAVSQQQVSGPYRLAGYSYGGMVAFEMARQLQREGKTVELLLLLDGSPDYVKAQTYFPRHGLSPHASRAQVTAAMETHFLLYFMGLYGAVQQKSLVQDMLQEQDTQEERVALAVGVTMGTVQVSSSVARGHWLGLKSKLGKAKQGDKRKVSIGHVADDVISLKRQEKAIQFLQAATMADQYDAGEAERFHGDVQLIRIKATPQTAHLLPADYGLSTLCTGSVVVRHVDGSHVTMLKDPFVTSVAAAVNAVLLTLGR